MVALDAAGRCRCWCATSTGCPICCSCWRASSIIAAGVARDRVVIADADPLSRRSTSRLTASKTARASSCDTRSRIAPHSTSTVPVDRFDRDVPAIAGDPFRAILELRRLLDRAPRDAGARRMAAIGEPLISTRTAAIRSLSIDALAVVEARRVLAEQHQIVAGRDLGDDRAAERALRVARALPPPPVEPAASWRGWRRRAAGRRRRCRRRGHALGSVSVVRRARWPEPLARAYAACEALARSHYENFPVASRLLPAADAAARRGRLRVRARRRRHRRRRRRRRRRSARRGSTPGSGGCTRPSPSSGRPSAPHEPRRSDRRRARRTRSDRSICRSRCSTIC